MSDRITVEQADRARRRWAADATPEASGWLDRVLALRVSGEGREAFEVVCCGETVPGTCRHCGWERTGRGLLEVHGLGSLASGLTDSATRDTSNG